MPDELFVEVTRNDTVESRHVGAAVVCDDRGNVVASWGNVERLIFPRSALKPFLAIDLVESGSSEHYGLSDAELSLACASHQGEPMHENLVKSWLARIGLSQDDLACGAALPDDMDSFRKVLAAGQQGCRAHHNCSGKHTGFLTNALHKKLPVSGFHLADHPLQQKSLHILSDLAGESLHDYPVGIDGCGFPAPTMPLQTLGRIAARFARPDGLSSQRAGAIRRLQQAMSREPFYTAGHGTVVSELIETSDGAVLAKTGAEGVLIAAIPARGLGIALKIADGNTRARPPAMLAILDHLDVLSDPQKAILQHHIRPQLRNSRDQVIGEIRAVDFTR